ncbi:interleukin-11 receptor subunit alpha isoform X1 [Pimephales promelas]|uniref:interleukin-11 receptor subunit alpha isoform X1 n=1 Tax=Pimephales promelas TaxID=90988 RepID=UPI0019556D89|nr:interleukin-11 receptor subunit alpha isoform X1 [Pimephales promelas]KAG1971027.1 ciliary neurotrophic factor receptor subunit alpha preproprotein [Pimephales promelas]KAG1971028.1 ciliary neurotrophic factor receptor subunit alpha preproprotein [Pimephales promelas]
MPGLVSCLGDLIVTGIIILFSDHVKSEIWTNEVSDVQFGGLGSRVTLTCGGSHGGSPVEWRFNGSSVPTWQTHEGSLALLNTTHSMEGNYSCHDERGTLLQSIKLRLGHPPHFVSVSCQVPNLMKIHCSWVETKTTHLPTIYRTSYSVVYSGRGVEPCEQKHIGVNECTITDPQFWSNSKVLVNITQINPLGSNSTIVQIDAHELLKPDPPEDVRVLPLEGQPTQLLVHWSGPSSWPSDSMFPLTYQLHYRPIGSSFWSTLETEENTSLKIMDALEGHSHQIQIRAQDALINHSQWSEWSHVVEARPWIEPWEEPTEEPDFSYPFDNLSSLVRTTGKSPDSLHSNGSLGLLVLLGLFAGVMVAVLLTIIMLIWVRQRKQDNVKKQELTYMVKMKSIPI